MSLCACVCLQPVGFVTFNTRAGAEAAKQDLQVRATQTWNSATAANSNRLRNVVSIREFSLSQIKLTILNVIMQKQEYLKVMVTTSTSF